MPIEYPTWVFHDLFKIRKSPFYYTLTLTAGVDPSAAAIIPAKTGYRVRITNIWWNCTTSAAQTLTIRDDNGTPLVLGIVPASIAVGGHHFEYGPMGLAATISKNVDLVASAAGYAGFLVIDGFYEAIGPFTQATL